MSEPMPRTADSWRTPGLAAKFDAMWGDAEAALAEGTYRADPRPRHGDPRWGLSLVVPVRGAVGEAITRDLGPIAEALSPHHVTYLPENLHCTVRSLEGYQDEVPQDQVDHYADLVDTVLKSCPPIEIALRGLGGSRGGLFVCGVPGEGLVRLRTALHEAGAANGPRAFASNDYAAVRDIAHVSVAVFRTPVVPERSIAGVVSARRTKHYGTIRPSALDLVRYDLAGAEITMSRLATVGCGR
ncbi:2'-5' RNA ligase family protein [Streptomyces sp. P6-2-1]|uniref:2'-5' RNA ligase family protein n=1 Tax=Streptomyces sp. P6-2-1 TaxID=3422591 RepID=UPI003D36028F